MNYFIDNKNATLYLMYLLKWKISKYIFKKLKEYKMLKCCIKYRGKPKFLKMPWDRLSALMFLDLTVRENSR